MPTDKRHDADELLGNLNQEETAEFILSLLKSAANTVAREVIRAFEDEDEIDPEAF